MIAALAPARCWCNAHDIGLACPAWIHRAIAADPKRLASECEFIGIQRFDDGTALALFNHHCGGTFSVEVNNGR